MLKHDVLISKGYAPPFCSGIVSNHNILSLKRLVYYFSNIFMLNLTHFKVTLRVQGRLAYEKYLDLLHFCRTCSLCLLQTFPKDFRYER